MGEKGDKQTCSAQLAIILDRPIQNHALDVMHFHPWLEDQEPILAANPPGLAGEIQQRLLLVLQGIII
ncbi:MAG TPA: hypothetical protein VF043_21170 [Ktedonobacteraceae bacterium]